MKLQKILSNILFRNYKNTSFCILLLSFLSLHSQELRVNVIIDDSQYSLPDRSIFKELKSSIENFVNNKIWTQDNYQENERISWNLVLNVQKESTITNFSCNAQIQSSRPIYNSSYESSLLNFADRNFTFSYVSGMQMEYNDNAYTNELTTLLAYYSYIVLGMDYDSYKLDGGKNYFQLAFQAMNNNSGGVTNPGWANDGKQFNNRYALIENLINPQYKDFHQSLYDYHRLGLDLITSKASVSQEKVLETLRKLNEIRILNTTSILLSTYMLAKRDEMINILKEANQTQKNEAVILMRSLDPSYSAKYMVLLK
jgi:hypothetical protein